jgi:hypothetical protein
MNVGKQEMREVIYFDLFGEKRMKIINTGHIFLLNYILPRFSEQPDKIV